MSDSPLISIVTPCYNDDQYIREAIESVRNQSYDNCEHIIVDGGSTDDTIDILDSFPEITYISEDDDGIYDAVNKGIEMASGSFVGWLNADDIYVDGAFESFLKAYRDSPSADIIVGNSDVFRDEDDEQVQLKEYRFTDPEKLSRGIIDHNSVALNGCLISADLIESIGLYDSTLDVAGDAEYLIRIASKMPDTVGVPDIVYRYRSHEESITFSDQEFGSVTKVGTEEMIEYLPRYFTDPSVPDQLRSHCRTKYRVRSAMLLRHHLFEMNTSGLVETMSEVLKTDKTWFYWAVTEAVPKSIFRKGMRR
ncbi:glycosyltransferase [Haloterrigena sp. SYSU A121-1]|uniref:Glycosyltransferase n=1 Tax=Haloterrigena gelatinilytica TaxID=2741724 RepID=A0A8J8GNC6_9EURY|nr:glycosyltransferase family 2 protein [Haloterrigena gelatinilytica]NUB93229.1 glycosyltransferase [Haloterrigena gelatinilytica]